MIKNLFIPSTSEEEIKRERSRAREIRKSQWWKNRRGNGICYYCRKRFRSSELTMDHIVPIIRGGKSRKGNVVASCKDCNNKKRYMLPTEWERYLESLI
jgi:5-methylcytosine-specific restriction endonuclease McrA